MSEEQTVNILDIPEDVAVEQTKLVGKRKLLVFGIILVVGIAIALYKGDIPSNLLQLLEVVFTGFMAGNVAGHALDAVVEHADIKYAPESPKVESSPIVVDTVAIEDLIKSQAQALDIIQQTLLMIIKKAGLDK